VLRGDFAREEMGMKTETVPDTFRSPILSDHCGVEVTVTFKGTIRVPRSSTRSWSTVSKGSSRSVGTGSIGPATAAGRRSRNPGYWRRESEVAQMQRSRERRAAGGVTLA